MLFYSGTADYLGINHYTSYLVTPDPDERKGIYKIDNGLLVSFDTNWPSTVAPWFKVQLQKFELTCFEITNVAYIRLF